MGSLFDLEVQLKEVMPVMLEYLAAGLTVEFKPQGVSMLPMLRQGVDSVVLSPLPDQLRKYDVPLYQRDNGKYILHRIVAVGETYTCIGDNQFDLERGVRQDQMIALVTGFYRGDKFHSVTEPGYRLYCRFWHYSRPVRHFWRRGIGWIRRHLR